jgi:Uma2 family endonuclease
VPRPPTNLPYSDGEPLESNWHVDAISFLKELVRVLFFGRTDFFVGGDMFIHFSTRRAFNRDFRGPDLFVVKEVDGTYDRNYWAIWEEDGRYPNLIIELLSPSTAVIDRTTKKDLYERTFRTPEYFLYDPIAEELEGWRMGADGIYLAIEANEQGRMWSQELGVWLGSWRGLYQGQLERVWLRFFANDGELVPLFAERGQKELLKEKERTENEKQRAENEKQRAETAQTELERLKQFLAEKGLSLPHE